MTPRSQRLSDEQMRRTWALIDILTSLKRRANHHPPPTAELIRRKFAALLLIHAFFNLNRVCKLAPQCLCS